MDTILTRFKRSAAYTQLVGRFSEAAEASVAQLSGAARSFLLSSLFEDRPGVYLVVTQKESQAERITNDINEILGEQCSFHFPEWGVNPYHWKSPISDVVGQRLETLAHLQQSDAIIVTASVRALMEPTIAPAELERSSLMLKLNQEIEIEDLTAKLVELGYERFPLVEEVGNFSVRGGIVDIFPHTTEHPIRIEFFGDFVESIRSFSVSTQRSLSTLDSVELLPQREILIDGEKLERFLSRIEHNNAAELLHEKFRYGIDYPGLEWAASLFLEKRHYLSDYLKDGTTLYLREPELVEDEAERIYEEFENRHEDVSHILPKPSLIYMQPVDVKSSLSDRPVIREETFSSTGVAVGFGTEDHPVINARMNFLKEKVESLHQSGLTVYVACDNKVQRDRMEDILGEQAEMCSLIVADLSEGFVFRDEKFVLLCDHQIFARKFHRYRRRRSREGVALSSYTNLNVGDYVVHVDYGIGRYKGLKEITVDKRRRDCLLIQYDGNDRLYVPIEEFNRVQKFVGKEGKPQLTKLGGTTWERVKARTKKAIADMAEELIRLYAERKHRTGFAFSDDDAWMRQLEASFQYDETTDQLRAIDEVKGDMRAPHPMDRLICGDVGFGKTEVAVRAAFKCVNDGKQVAVLVPTTILAQQHLTTFRERLKDFPIKIEMLSRFRTRKQQKEIVAELEEGKVDIVVGTHRLLSKDIKFRELGLLVVDEEQRFGVAHKEKIKKLKRLVDVISMSATPIPRTMQMSLLGARDMSIISTSPKDRLPINTEIAEFHPDAIKNAILSELERGGQVYFVHNRVQSIMSIYNYLQKLLPTARICIGHGQMPEKELEEVMQRFLDKQYDILLSTSIIESGLDIPNVNTIVINRADRFGLAQLYQLRGRVGRSAKKASAFLLIPPIRLLSATARKRLKAIEQHTELGSGFHLAMRDLEIRGAGNLLGPQQHGFIEEVGFDLYLKLLDEAVSEIKGEEPKRQISVKVESDVDLYLPSAYIPDNRQKVDIYQRLAQAATYETVSELELELKDRYGDLPEPAENLIRMAEIKILAARAGIEKVSFKKGALSISYAQDILPGKQKVAVLASQVEDPLEFSSAGKFEIYVDFSGRDDIVWHEQTKNILQNLTP